MVEKVELITSFFGWLVVVGKRTLAFLFRIVLPSFAGVVKAAKCLFGKLLLRERRQPIELGSSLFLTDANGVQTDKYVYNAWGKVVSSSGTTANPFRYVGRLGYYPDVGTGLYWVGTRFYTQYAGCLPRKRADQFQQMKESAPACWKQSTVATKLAGVAPQYE